MEVAGFWQLPRAAEEGAEGVRNATGGRKTNRADVVPVLSLAIGGKHGNLS